MWAKRMPRWDRPPAPGSRWEFISISLLGRKRCHFCYLQGYTDKNAAEIELYLEAAIQELTLYSQKTFIGGRKPKFSISEWNSALHLLRSSAGSLTVH